MNHSRKKQQGSVLVLFAVCLIVLIAVLGIALDSGLSYLLKAKLSAAADAAALAAGEAITQGADHAQREANARDTATKIFWANIPPNYIGATVALKHIDIVWKGAIPEITVNAQASNPTSFGRILGLEALNVNTAPTVTQDRSGSRTDVALLVDNSNSIVDSQDQDHVRDSVNNYVAKFNADNDRISLTQFGHQIRIYQDPVLGTITEAASIEAPFHAKGFDPLEIKTKMDGLYQRSGGTPTAQAFYLALQELNKIKDATRLQYVTIFTDGLPNKTLTGRQDDDQGQEDARVGAEALRKAGYKIYGIGFKLNKFPQAISQMKCWANTEDAEKACRQPTQPTGKVCFSEDPASLDDCFDKMLPPGGNPVLIQ